MPPDHETPPPPPPPPRFLSVSFPPGQLLGLLLLHGRFVARVRYTRVESDGRQVTIPSIDTYFGPSEGPALESLHQHAKALLQGVFAQARMQPMAALHCQHLQRHNSQQRPPRQPEGPHPSGDLPRLLIEAIGPSSAAVQARLLLQQMAFAG